nr:MoaD/ThiS family protein [Actinomycetota bacterium]
MPVLRLFAAAREAAGVARAELDGATVGAILQEAELRYGERFSGVLAHSRVWVNGQPAEADTAVHGHDVIAVLPPVSGGSDVDQPWGAKAAAVEAEPAPEESPVAIGLLEIEGEATQAHEVVWPDISGELYVQEPEWLAPEVEAGPPDPGSPPEEQVPPPDEQMPPLQEQGWSGWSSASESSQAVATPAPPVSFAAPSRPQPPPLEDKASVEAPTTEPFTSDPATSDPTTGDPTTTEAPSPLLEGGLRKAVTRLAVVHDSKGPHGRLGLLWALVTVGAAIGGPESLAAWLGLTAFVG